MAEWKHFNLSGRREFRGSWGNQNGGSFQFGTYMIDFWWKGLKIGEKKFTVYRY